MSEYEIEKEFRKRAKECPEGGVIEDVKEGLVAPSCQIVHLQHLVPTTPVDRDNLPPTITLEKFYTTFERVSPTSWRRIA